MVSNDWLVKVSGDKLSKIRDIVDKWLKEAQGDIKGKYVLQACALEVKRILDE